MRLRASPAAALFLILAAAPALAAPKADLWPKWAAHDEASAATVDNSAWAAFLARYLVAGADGVSRLKYAEVDAAGRAALDGYVANLAARRPTALRRAQQLAYWINLYNALTVQVVLAHYPVKRILDIDISPGWFSTGPWGKKLVTIEGARLSLDDIEHRILRPVWKDPRIHYAVNCASLGCPNLAAAPYEAADMDARLDAAAKAYINSPRGVFFVDGELGASSLYKWYADDFGGDDKDDDRGVIHHLLKYASPSLRLKLGARRGISTYAYDWRLNDASTKP